MVAVWDKSSNKAINRIENFFDLIVSTQSRIGGGIEVADNKKKWPHF